MNFRQGKAGRNGGGGGGRQGATVAGNAWARLDDVTLGTEMFALGVLFMK